MIIVCSHCGTSNRVDQAKLVDKPNCAHCKQPLVPADAIEVDEAIARKILSTSELPVVVDFWASWCGPCQMMGPQFKKAAQDYNSSGQYAQFIKVNTESAHQISALCQIRSIPTMIMFKVGKEVARVSGAMNSTQIISWVNTHLK